MRRATAVAALLAGLVALIGVPALLSKDLVERPVANENFDRVFNYLENFTAADLDRTRSVDRSLFGEGGTSVPVRCLRMRRSIAPAEPDLRWICTSLSADGEVVAAIWAARDPADRPERLIAADKDDSTVPNP